MGSESTASGKPTLNLEKAPKFDPKSPPKSQRSHRILSERANQHSQREAGHEAFGLTPPPSAAEISKMMLITAVRTLKDFDTNAELVVMVCDRIIETGGRSAEQRQDAADAGALQSIQRAMNLHHGDAKVQDKAMVALGNICCGTDEAGLRRKQLAADAGVLHAIIAGMEEHLDVGSVQENACAVLGNIASNIDSAGLGRKQAAVSAGAISAIVAAMTKHLKSPRVQDYGCFALGNICRSKGDSDNAEEVEQAIARKKAAVAQGALDAVVAAMKAHEAEEGIQEHGARALANMTYKNDELKKSALDKGAESEWLDGMTTARAMTARDPQREIVEAQASHRQEWA